MPGMRNNSGPGRGLPPLPVPWHLYHRTGTHVLPSLTHDNAADRNSLGCHLTLPKTVRGKHTDPVQNIRVYHCMTFFPPVAMLAVPFTTSRESSDALNTQKATHNYCVIWNAHNTTALLPNVRVIRTHRLAVTNTGRSAFAKASHSQGQLHTPGSVSLHNIMSTPLLHLAMPHNIW